MTLVASMSETSDAPASATLAPEDALILAAARSDLRAADRGAVVELVSGRLDWDYILDVGVRHGVAPLLSRSLARVDLPTAARGGLDSLYENSRRRNDRLFEALGEAVVELDRRGVMTLGLKDVQLAAEVYPDRALRPMGDIDLLIRESDYDLAATALAGLGYRPRPHEDAPYARKYAMGQHFVRSADEIWLDIQWNVAQRAWDASPDSPHTYRVDDLWASATPLLVDDYRLLAPSPEHMLVHLCLHLEGHEYSELILFCDIVELLRHHGDQLDWDEVVRLTRAQGAESTVHHVLLMVERLFGISLPAGLLDQLESPYFAGALFAPVFGNLAPLHSSLDEIKLAASPAQETLDELESVVRRQAARAKALYGCLDQLADEFVRRGGRLIAFAGGPSPRIFPDAALPAFGQLEAVILDEDVQLLHDTVLELGFAGRGGYPTLAITLDSEDPALGKDASSLLLAVDFAPPPAPAHPESSAPSNRQAASASLKARLSGRPDDGEALVRLSVAAVPAEELLQTLAGRAASRPEGRLFGLCSMLHAARRLPSPLEAFSPAGGPVDEGSRLLAALLPLLGPDERSRLHADGLTEASPARLLEWARYGPGSADRYPLLRPLYYVALCFFSSCGVRAKAQLIGRALRGGPGRAHGIRPLLRELAVLPRRGVRVSRPLAYWTEPEPVPSTRATVSESGVR